MMNYRQNTLLKQTGASVHADWAAGYTVTAYPVGAVATANSSGTTATVAPGHSFRIGDKALIDPGGDNTFTDTVDSLTATTLVFTSSYSVASGDRIVNLGPDAGTTSPLYTASPMWIFSDPYSTAITNAQVTCSSLGEYQYWHRGDGRFWELVRDSGGTVVDVICGFAGVTGRLNICDYGAKGDNSTNALTRIQATVDAAAAQESLATSNIGKGGVVFVPWGRFVVNGSIVLPKAEQATHPRVVSLIGAAKHSSYITGGTGFSSGDAVIEWDQTVFKLWDQHIENLTIQAPAIDGTFAVLYAPTSTATWAAANAEACTIVMHNVEFEGANQYNPAFVRIQGIARNCRFTKIFADPILTNRVYDTLAFHFDETPLAGSGEDNAFDDAGCNFGHFSHIWCTPQRGGYCGLFKGRAGTTVFDNCEVGLGNWDDPILDLNNSVNVEFRNLWSEGRGETPQILLTDCRFVRFYGLMLGHPNQPTSPSTKASPWAGNGIEMVACTDCLIERGGDDYGFTSWQGVDTGLLKVVTLDANCLRNRIIMSDNLDSPYAFANEITDSGTDNWIDLLDHSDSRYWYRGGPVAHSLRLQGDTQEYLWIQQITEEIAINNTGTATFDSSTNLLPADSFILGVVARCSATVGGSRTYGIGCVTGPSLTRFHTGGINATDGITARAWNHLQGGVATDALGPVQVAADKIRLTLSGNPTDTVGKIRVTVFYYSLRSPQSDT